MSKAYKNPEHAAFISKAQTFSIPNLSQTIFAVAGINISGVEVATIKASTSCMSF